MPGHRPRAPRPPAVRVLGWLLLATALTTVVVELLNWRYGPEQGFVLAVRTAWALLRALGFLALIWYVRTGRAVARPFGLILTVTTVFAVARLLVPREGLPAGPGLAGFAVLCVLCAVVVWALYRWRPVRGYLDRRPARRPVPPRLLTARVAALTYAPLMAVPALAALGTVGEAGPFVVPVALAWIVFAVVVGYLIFLLSLFVPRGAAWARHGLVGLSALVLAVSLPLCWLLFGPDGLVRDGVPLVVTAGLAVWGATGRVRPAAGTEPAGPPAPPGRAVPAAPPSGN